MDWAVIISEMAGAAVLVALGCFAWTRFKIYRIPTSKALVRADKKDHRELRHVEQMKSHILELIGKMEADEFNRSGMFLIQDDFVRLGGLLERDYLDQLDMLLRNEGLSLLLPDPGCEIIVKKPMWVRPLALSYFLDVALSQTSGLTQEIQESARRLMFIWFRCAVCGMKIEAGLDADMGNLEHRRWLARRMIHYTAMIKYNEGLPHGLQGVDASTIEDRCAELDEDCYTDEEYEASASQVSWVKAA